MYVDLDFQKDATPAERDRNRAATKSSRPAARGLAEIEDKASALLDKLQALPLEETVKNATEALASIKAAVGRPEQNGERLQRQRAALPQTLRDPAPARRNAALDPQPLGHDRTQTELAHLRQTRERAAAQRDSAALTSQPSYAFQLLPLSVCSACSPACGGAGENYYRLNAAAAAPDRRCRLRPQRCVGPVSLPELHRSGEVVFASGPNEFQIPAERPLGRLAPGKHQPHRGGRSRTGSRLARRCAHGLEPGFAAALPRRARYPAIPRHQRTGGDSRSHLADPERRERRRPFPGTAALSASRSSATATPRSSRRRAASSHNAPPPSPKFALTSRRLGSAPVAAGAGRAVPARRTFPNANIIRNLTSYEKFATVKHRRQHTRRVRYPDFAPTAAIRSGLRCATRSDNLSARWQDPVSAKVSAH